jgi:hypothetical protein
MPKMRVREASSFSTGSAQLDRLVKKHICDHITGILAAAGYFLQLVLQDMLAYQLTQTMAPTMTPDYMTTDHGNGPLAMVPPKHDNMAEKVLHLRQKLA